MQVLCYNIASMNWFAYDMQLSLLAEAKLETYQKELIHC